MAEVFNRLSGQLGTTGIDMYVAPNNAATDRVVVLSIMVANVNGTNAADVTCRIKNAAGNDIPGATIASTISVPADSTLELIANKLILKNGEKLHLFANTNSHLETTISVLEIS